MKQLIKNILASRGYQILRDGHLPKGLSCFTDLKAIVHTERFGLAMDVGAHHGSVTRELLAAFPNARVIAVEPSPEAQGHLNERFGRNRRVSLQFCGAGAEEASMELRIFGNTQLNTFKPVIERDEDVSLRTVKLPLRTVESIRDAIAPTQPLDFLKIDTEGFEMPCLLGANSLFERNEVGCVILEVGFCDDDERHTQFQLVMDFMRSRAFSFYAIYDLYHYRRPTELLFANALFINDTYLRTRGLLKL